MSDPANDALAAFWVIFIVIVGAIELSALGRIYGYAPGWTKTPFASVRDVIISGFVLLVVLYVVFEILFQN